MVHHSWSKPIWPLKGRNLIDLVKVQWQWRAEAEAFCDQWVWDVWPLGWRKCCSSASLKGQLSYRLLFSNVLQGLLDHLSPQSEWLLSVTYSYVTPKTSATGSPTYYIPVDIRIQFNCLICERVLYTQKLQNTLTWCMTIEISNIRQGHDRTTDDMWQHTRKDCIHNRTKGWHERPQ